MTSVLGFKLLRLNELRARLDRITPAVQDNLRIYMAQFVLDLRDQVRNNILDRFKVTRMGLLWLSVQAQLIEEIGSVTGRVFIDGVPYAAIQEYGGTTSPHEILPVNGTMLAFMAPASMGFSSGDMMNGLVFAKKVNHPGSRIPERSYARLALVQTRPIFENGIRAAVNSALADSGKSL